MAGYTRQDTNDNIATGKVINASDFDNEYNAIQTAFNASGGHKHDGTAAEGARITVIGPAGQATTDANAFFSTTTATIGLGKTGNVWKDLHVDNIKIDGNIISSIDTNGNIELAPDGSGLVNLQAAGDLAINGVALTANSTEFNTLSGLTATTNELNILDGSNTVQATVTLADADGVVISDADDSDTMKQALVSDIATYIAGKTMSFTNKTFDANGTGNGITNLEVNNFTTASIVTESEGLNSSDNDTSIPTTAAVKDYVDDNNLAGGKIGDASDPVVFEVTVASKTAANPYASGVNHGGGSASGSAYFINGQESPSLEVFGHDVISASNVGRIHYKFDQSNGSNSGHPLQFYLDAAKTVAYNPGSHVTTSGVPGNAGAYTLLKVDKDTPHQLYYQCSAHPYMGGLISNSMSTVFNSTAVASTSGLLTLPTTDDTLVGRATTDTLTNKTITTLVNGGAITVPTGTDTLVARDTTDTLTNKTLTNPTITEIHTGGAKRLQFDSYANEFIRVSGGGSGNYTDVTFTSTDTSAPTVRINASNGTSNTGTIELPQNLRIGGSNVSASGTEISYNDLPGLIGLGWQGKTMVTDSSGDFHLQGEFTANSYNDRLISNTSATGSMTLTLESANTFHNTLTGNVTYTFSNPPSTQAQSSANLAYGFTLKIKQDGTGNRSITWPASVDWVGGSAPTLTGTANSVDVFTFFTTDAGTTYYGFVAGLDVK